ncbi:23S rRNA (adenine(2503)-C(2))-methyltransferase RlmN [Roseibacillus persicicus]|uniref:23S rRNA (adenine(2503)-C(2))-methyltransferase RlmN n=1 Tax=Roseibacillus persicicus TaxID=454148 RepID=UPI00280CF017|nr:23S rRNA (adenine(2503)-C(2))-methyltransferase RlmN [Roseibacillus persicicus]MDQ8188882.1 23S rRNA (adenine(2503)-C(2))-methyltransferase RlmN [Roseibacillus persicicus]
MADIPNLRSLTADEFTTSFQALGQPAYRSAQILDWLWKKRVSSIDEMSNLPVSLRETLKEKYELSAPTIVRAQGSKDTTRKLLLKLKDGRFVECVLIPASPALYGEQSDRLTLCVSSQVGCAFACKFCASGLLGFTRNLTPGEITAQILLAEELAGTRVNNLVFMGMGEPLANLPSLLKAIELITSPEGLHIGARHLTISTSGLVPQIKKLADHPRQIRLAISLHGATDEVRSKIMPVNDRWGVDELFEALRYWNSKKKQHLTLEYILIKGINDDLEQARILAKRAKAIRAKVNLIPYNTVEGLPWERPSEDHCRAFRDILKNSGISATLRLEKGHDIDAACGQLRLREETNSE